MNVFFSTCLKGENPPSSIGASNSVMIAPSLPSLTAHYPSDKQPQHTRNVFYEFCFVFFSRYLSVISTQSDLYLMTFGS